MSLLRGAGEDHPPASPKDIKRKRATDRQELLMDSIRTKLISEGKVKIYNDEIQKMVAAYRKR